MDQKNLSRKQLADLWGISPSTLAVWASTKRYALPYIKIGRRVLYRMSDVEAFMAANIVGAQVTQ